MSLIPIMTQRLKHTYHSKIKVHRSDMALEFSTRTGKFITYFVANIRYTLIVKHFFYNLAWHISWLQKLLVYHLISVCNNLMKLFKCFFFGNSILLLVTVDRVRDISSAHVILMNVTHVRLIINKQHMNY